MRKQDLLKREKKLLAKLEEIKKRGGSELLDHGYGAVEADKMEVRVLEKRLSEVKEELGEFDEGR
jgi:hypothetical protein